MTDQPTSVSIEQKWLKDLEVGDVITVNGFDKPEYNGKFKITKITDVGIEIERVAAL